MKKILIILFLIVQFGNVWSQQYTYSEGYFEKEGDLWCEYKPGKSEGVWNYYMQTESREDYYIIEDGTYKIAVPKTMAHNFLVCSVEKEEWKLYAPRVARPKRPTLTEELKAKAVRNFRPSTPYDGIHLYTSPFGYLNTTSVTIDEAKQILNYSGCFTVTEREDGCLDAVRKGNIGYENFLPVEDTLISGQFDKDANRLRQCTYTFTFSNRSQADQAARHLREHLDMASKGKIVGRRYQVNWLHELSFFDVRVDERAGKSQLIVDVEYR